jgi:hypothetical protein
MIVKDKAIELVNKYLQIYDGRVIEAKKCALIAVDELISETGSSYWYNVRKEIEKL